MKMLRILAWGLLFLISGTSNAAITIHATSAAVDRLIGMNDDFDIRHNLRYDENIGESHPSMSGHALLGLASQENLGLGTGVGMVVDRSLRFLGSDNNYHIALDSDSILGRKYAVILGILPDGSSTLISEINTRGPEPDVWAIIMLCIGFVIYQMRPRNALRATNLDGDI